MDEGKCVNSLATQSELLPCYWWFVCYPCSLQGYYGLCHSCATGCHRDGTTNKDGRRHKPLYQYLAQSPICDCKCFHDQVNWALV
jgi:hypothetical protein